MSRGAPSIFLGYRRVDSRDVAGRIFDRLTGAFGEAAVFKDVDSMPLGMDFRTHVSDIIVRSDIFLAIIGPSWVNAADDQGRRRLDNPADLVRVELEAAFAAEEKWIVPVLVGGAEMPQPDELPDTLQKLAYLHAAVVRPDPDFNTDMGRLLKALQDGLARRQQLPKQEPEPKDGTSPVAPMSAYTLVTLTDDRTHDLVHVVPISTEPANNQPSLWKSSFSVPFVWAVGLAIVTTIALLAFRYLADTGWQEGQEAIPATEAAP